MKFKSKEELRLLRAKRIAQEMRTLKREGVIYLNNPLEEVTLAEYKVRFLKELTWRINRADKTSNHDKVNATRAGDIIINGESSKWKNSRTSWHHAGSDRRGICHWVKKFETRLATQ